MRERHLETSVQRLGRRTGNFAEMLFCCPILFIFFSSSCSAGQWLRRSILTLMSHTYQKHLALGISLLPQSWSPCSLSFPFKWKGTNYYVEILHIRIWRAPHWSWPNLSITAVQEQLQITFVIRVGPIRWATDAWVDPVYGLSSSQFMGWGQLKSRKKSLAVVQTSICTGSVEEKIKKFQKHHKGKHPLFLLIFFVILWGSTVCSWGELSPHASHFSGSF